MKIRNTQSGFSVVEIVIIVTVIAVLGFVGYSVYNRQQTKTADTTSQTAGDVKSAPEINSTSDLDKASTTLDQTDPSGSNNTDAGELDSQLSAF